MVIKRPGTLPTLHKQIVVLVQADCNEEKKQEKRRNAAAAIALFLLVLYYFAPNAFC